MSTNSGISFIAPLVPKAHSLTVLDSSLHIAALLAGRALPSYPPLRLSQILKLIKNGTAEAVTVMEWLGVFGDKLEIDDAEACDEACILLWHAISEDERVSRIALHQAALYLEGSQDKFPTQMIDSLEVAAPLMKAMSSKRVNWLIALRDANFNTCINMSVEVNKTPFEYHKYVGMPAPAFFRSDFVKNILPYYSNHNKGKDVEWLISCTSQMTHSELISFSDDLLLNHEHLIPELASWLSAHCLPRAKDTLWIELTPYSRSILKNHFKLSSFYALNSLVDKMCQHYAINLLKLTDRDLRQLRSRVKFWSNYSERFSQVRLLIPYQTSCFLGLKGELDGVEVIQLPDSQDENSEVCIFEIENNIIVEVLRGDASEIRIFESTSRNKNRLLQDNNLTLRAIRKMACAIIHDHVKLWQYFCEQVLRIQCGVNPNEGLKHFNGMHKSVSAYSHRIGLVKPSRELVDERLSQLEAWDDAFWSREARIKGLEYSEVKGRGWRELQQAKIYKVMEDKEQYLRNLNLAADVENPEAMYLLGTTLISSHDNSAAVKKRGEYMITRSASLGFEPAIEVAKKFGLQPKESNKLNATDLKRLQKRLVREKPSGSQSVSISHDKNNESVTQELSEELKNKIRESSDRPYLALFVEDLEELSQKQGHDKKVKEKLLFELKHRTKNQRIKRLVDTLNG